MRTCLLYSILIGFLLPPVLTQGSLKDRIHLAGESSSPVQAAPSSGSLYDADVARINQQRENVKMRLAQLKGELKKQPEIFSPPDYTFRKIDLLERIYSTLAQHLMVLQESVNIQDELERESAILNDSSRNDLLAAPVSLVKYDALIDLMELAQERKRQTEDRYQLALAEEERARKNLRDKETAHRLQKEVVETSNGKADQPSSLLQLSIIKLEKEQAQALTALREAELNHEKFLQLMLEKQVNLHQTSLALAKTHVVFTEGDLNEQLANLDDRMLNFKAELLEAEKGLIQAENHLAEAEQAATTSDVTPAQQAQISASRMERRYRQRQIAVINMRLYRNVQAKLLWERRYRMLGGNVSDEEKLAWIKEAREIQEQLTREGRLQKAKLADLQEEIRDAEGLINKAGPNSEEVRGHENRLSWITRQQVLAQDNQAGIQRTQRLAQKLAFEGEGSSSSEKFKNARLRLGGFLRSTWNFEIGVVDERPITTKKMVLALLLFFVGLRLSRWFSHRIVHLVLRRTRTDSSGRAAVQSIIFYLLVVVISVMALYLANIPLGLFALLGGALAIGVGFGSQNIINNFISGLILMMERPIRVGDMVDVEGNYGQVIRIGARCTQVLTGNNIDLMVPNSVFLENNVINWTLSNDRFRCMVSVGAAYGSNTRQVEELLQEAASTTQGVAASPKPHVIFRDFGDNSLLFEVHFWIRMKSQMERFTVESAVRFQIDKLFHDAGVIIAFPQRDVHLNTLNPLEVRLVKPDSDDPSA